MKSIFSPSRYYFMSIILYILNGIPFTTAYNSNISYRTFMKCDFLSEEMITVIVRQQTPSK